MTAAIGLTLRILFFIALYSFLAFAVWVIWKSVSAKDLKPGNILIPSITLAWDNGEETILQSFSSAELLVGREPECDFVLANATVSSRHARLSFHQNQWWFEDLKSTNGSYLDDLRIEEPIVLKDGDDVSCGDVIIHVTIKNNNA
ncbi:MAG TPA: FHA domain-containing protein [Anaerolineaceae bacterium]|nr:FHA domain-containing protein [Anaerolineaceae bacterium]HPT24030.1 FHA domain-containing protein [Anaerolineaceae bacterium]